jgi:hypothetical protein
MPFTFEACWKLLARVNTIDAINFAPLAQVSFVSSLPVQRTEVAFCIGNAGDALWPAPAVSNLP